MTFLSVSRAIRSPIVRSQSDNAYIGSLRLEVDDDGVFVDETRISLLLMKAASKDITNGFRAGEVLIGCAGNQMDGNPSPHIIFGARSVHKSYRSVGL